MTVITDVVGTGGVYLYLLHKFSKINFAYGIISGPWRDDTFKKPEVKNLGDTLRHFSENLCVNSRYYEA
jgi:hypothetical protein